MHLFLTTESILYFSYFQKFVDQYNLSPLQYKNDLKVLGYLNKTFDRSELGLLEMTSLNPLKCLN